LEPGGVVSHPPTEEQPRHYSDDELIQRAIDNGWEQLVAVTDRFPGSKAYPWTGWLVKPTGPGIPVRPGVERTEWVGDYRNRHQETYVDSWARLPRQRLAHEDRCGECGLLIEYGGFIGMEPERAPLPFCWDCKFWLARIPLKPGCFVATDRHSNGPAFYSIGPNSTLPSSRNGFGGHWFTIRFLDGTERRTCDLWFGGPVPDRFQDRLPITAEFARPSDV
jgi:hypothetical protein